MRQSTLQHIGPLRNSAMHQNVIARKPRNERVLPSEAQAAMKFATHALMNLLSPNLAAQQQICPAWVPFKNALSSPTGSRKTCS